ncbi:MAG: alternative ribosome rescue aminoacyl-tRNA hydrolase ArfB [Bradymonadia bacterium]
MEDLTITGGPTIPGAELQVVVSRASGPGGQHVNKTSTRITLRWSVKDSAVLSEGQRAWLLQRLSHRLIGGGDLQVSVDEYRSQLRNREAARARLADVVSKALQRPKARRATRPSKGAKARRLNAKKQRGALKASRRKPGMDD